MSDALKYCTAAFWAASGISCVSVVLHMIGRNSSEPFPVIVLLPYLLLPSFLILGFRHLSGSRRRLSLAFWASAVAYYLALAVFVLVVAAAPVLTATLRGAVYLSGQVLMLSYVSLCAVFGIAIRPNEKSIWSFILWFLVSFFWYVTFHFIGRRFRQIQV